MTSPNKPQKYRSKGRFVWLWHPHFWLSALLILIVIIVLAKFAK